jgi:glutaredoxin
MQPTIVIYTSRYCPYCFRAKALLDSKGLRYQEIVVDDDAALRAEMEQKSGRYTVPQIMSGVVTICTRRTAVAGSKRYCNRAAECEWERPDSIDSDISDSDISDSGFIDRSTGELRPGCALPERQEPS